MYILMLKESLNTIIDRLLIKFLRSHRNIPVFPKSQVSNQFVQALQAIVLLWYNAGPRGAIMLGKDLLYFYYGF